VKAAAPPAPVAAVSAPEAFQLLAAALVEAQKAAAPTNPLLPQKQLLEAAQAGFHITSDQLGQLLGMSRSTITSKKSGFIKLGFCFEKIKEGSTTLWKVSQAT
jgi:ParB-like chromosome segregation protein Spo0J